MQNFKIKKLKNIRRACWVARTALTLMIHPKIKRAAATQWQKTKTFMTRNRHLSQKWVHRAHVAIYAFVIVPFVLWQLAIEMLPYITNAQAATPIVTTREKSYLPIEVKDDKKLDDGVVAGRILTTREEIIAEIERVFGSEAQNAIKVANCESTFIATKIGDNHLTFVHNNQVYGRSTGIFQIRSGGVDCVEWNKEGTCTQKKKWFRTDNVRQFEFDMQDARKNISYAKTIYDKSGWQPWTCKSELIK